MKPAHRIVNVEQNYDKWYEFGSEQDIALADLNVILMRKDPPFDTEYIYCTYIERAEEKGRLSLINRRACATATKSSTPPVLRSDAGNAGDPQQNTA